MSHDNDWLAKHLVGWKGAEFGRLESVECGTEEIAQRARAILPDTVKVTVEPKWGQFGWVAYTRKP